MNAAMVRRDQPRLAGDLVPLAERLRALQLFRLATAGLVLALAVFVAPALGAGVRQLGGGTAVFLLVSLTSEACWRRFRQRGLVLFGAMLITDGVFLAWLSYSTGGPESPLRALILVHVMVVALLASYRTGLKLALWHSLLLLVVFYAQQTRVLPRGHAVSLHPGGEFARLIAFVTVCWVVAIATSVFSAMNERELRRRRYDLEALAGMGAELEDATDSVAVADTVLRHVIDTFGFIRGVVIAGPGEDLSLLASHHVPPTSPVPIGPESVIAHVRHNRTTLLVSTVDPHADPWLAALLPAAHNLVALPLSAEGRCVGVLVAEHGLRSGSRVERRVVSTAERFTSHAALALRNAWLLEQVRRAAATDGLTAVGNRRTFETTLDQELERAMRGGVEVSLVMIDIDHFKALNDNHGHQVGDDVLRQVGAILSRECRQIDTIARYGGEEFAVILPGSGEADSLAVAGRLLRALSEAITPATTASAGVATFPLQAGDARELVAAADEALYDSKRLGRDRVTASRGAPERQAVG
jgi:diguanylate cyclase (GGDEF)-like protein